MELEDFFRQLYAFLDHTQYFWETLTPERLQECRSFAESYPPLVQFFGLGAKLNLEQLAAEGMSEALAREALRLRPAVSRLGRLFVAHEHWGLVTGGPGYIYFGSETQSLIKAIQPSLNLFRHKSVLDLGSGAGGISLSLSDHAERVLGMEIYDKAVKWAQASARAQGLSQIGFVCSAVGTPPAELAAGGHKWDIAVFNPPLALPNGTENRVYRDGGALGVEIPLMFLDFSARRLRVGSHVFCLVTNPIVHGKSYFFDHLNSQVWQTEQEIRLHDHYNHGLYRKENYAVHGIQRVELWFLHLQLRNPHVC